VRVVGVLYTQSVSADQPVVLDGYLLDPKTLGSRVKTKRLSLKLSLRAAAEQTGISAPTLSRVERGLRLPDRANLERLVDWAGLKVGSFPSALPPNRVVEPENLSVPEAVTLHLRADPGLKPEQAEALAEMFKLAYLALSGDKPAEQDTAR
jgi:transcriptional regulator with XRE-family HTH domain